MISAQQATVISDGVIMKRMPELLDHLSKKINAAAEEGHSSCSYWNAVGLEWKDISSSNQKIIHQELKKLGFWTANISGHLRISW